MGPASGCYLLSSTAKPPTSTNTTRTPSWSSSPAAGTTTSMWSRRSSNGARSCFAPCFSNAAVKFLTCGRLWPSTVERKHRSICEEIRPYDTSDDHRRASRDRVPTEERQGRAPRKPHLRARRETRDVQGDRRLRDDGDPADRERHPLRTGHHFPGRARPGEDAHRAPSHRAARRVRAGDRRLRDKRRSLRSDLRRLQVPGGERRRLG